jgi:hypothetical protein
VMLAGSPVAHAEVADFNFALIATQLKREQFSARVRRMKRRGTRSLLCSNCRRLETSRQPAQRFLRDQRPE